MSDIKIQPSATGTATVTLTAPATNTARTITFPDSTSTLLASDGSGASLTGILTGITDNSNATAITIDSSENVGIGTSSPDTLLHLSEGSTNVAGGGNAGITMTNKYDSPDNSWAILPQRTGLSNTGLEIRDVTDSRSVMSFDGAGNVGIGTSSPNSELVVIGNVRTGSNTTPTSTIQSGTTVKSTQVLSTAGQSNDRGGAIELGGFYDNGTTTTTIFGAVAGLKEADATGVESGYLSLQTNSGGTIAERMRIDSSGNVGIGVTPESDIYSSRPHLRIGSMGSISATTDSTGDQMYISNNCRQISTSNAGGWKYINTDTASQYQQMGGYHEFRVAPSGSADAAISWTTAMTIANNGYTGFGVGSPTIRIHLNGGTATAANSGIAAAWNVHSDYRMKENIVPLIDATERLKKLNPIRFNWNFEDGTPAVDGFLAHEAQEIVPEAVSGTKDAVDDDGNPDYQGIDQSKLVPLLVSALQEAITRIETLENE